MMSYAILSRACVVTPGRIASRTQASTSSLIFAASFIAWMSARLFKMIGIPCLTRSYCLLYRLDEIGSYFVDRLVPVYALEQRLLIIVLDQRFSLVLVDLVAPLCDFRCVVFTTFLMCPVNDPLNSHPFGHVDEQRQRHIRLPVRQQVSQRLSLIHVAGEPVQNRPALCTVWL